MTTTQTAKANRAERLFNAALTRVESKSIREWATSEHNRPIWIRIAEGHLKRGAAAEFTLATDIVASAIGLW